MTRLEFKPNSNQCSNGSRLLSVYEKYGINHDNNNNGSDYKMKEKLVSYYYITGNGSGAQQKYQQQKTKIYTISNAMQNHRFDNE